MSEHDIMINNVDWSNYATIYGRADGTPTKDGISFNVPQRLRELFCGDEEKALTAADELYYALCVKPVLYSAALPAYDIVMHCLRVTDNDELRNALMDIVFAIANRASENPSDDDIHLKLLDKLMRDIVFFKELSHDSDVDIAESAGEICEMLERSSNVGF